MTTATKLDIQELEQADAATLRRVWLEIKGSEPPKTFTGRLMRLALAWNVQMTVARSEPSKTRRVWKRVIRNRSDIGAATNGGDRLPGAAQEGMRIFKNWVGITHEVLVTEGGATWTDQNYSSRSAVARAMTGTNRNGPKFFGLREGSKS